MIRWGVGLMISAAVMVCGCERAAAPSAPPKATPAREAESKPAAAELTPAPVPAPAQAEANEAPKTEPKAARAPAPVVVVWDPGSTLPTKEIKPGAAFVLWSDGLCYRRVGGPDGAAERACKATEAQADAVAAAADRVMNVRYSPAPDESVITVVRVRAEVESRVHLPWWRLWSPARSNSPDTSPAKFADLIDAICTESDTALLGEAQMRVQEMSGGLQR